MFSKRIKYARMHLSRRQYTNLLAQPNWRRLKKWTIHIAPNAFTVSRSALKSRTPRRIEIMAQPLTITKKYVPITQLTKLFPTQSPPGKTVSQRIAELSLPSKRIVLYNKKIVPAKERLNQLLTEIHKSRYQKYRIICNTLLKKNIAKERKRRRKRFKKLVKPEDWLRHEERLKVLAVPKPVHLPEDSVSNKERKQMRRFNMEHIQMLAQPVIRKELDSRDPFSVSPSALVYKATDHIQRLAVYRSRPILEPLVPGQVSRAALKYVAGPRIIELALHAARSPGREIDVKEDAFTVPRSALVYKCTPNIKRLAQPKKYGKTQVKKTKRKK